MKTKTILSILAGVLVLNSCSSDFLNVPLQGQPTAETDPNLAQNLVIGVYNSLLNGQSFGAEGDAHGIAFVTATNIISDDADKGSTASDQAGTVGVIDNFTVTPTNLFVQSLWAGHYNGIAKANNALVIIEKSTLSESEKARLTGEVKFIRGYYYFNLVRWFGGVPKILRVPANAEDANNDPVFQTRASVDDIYKVIVEDMQYAVDNLPLRGNTQAGRISKGTAQAMLAKVYLYLKTWDQAYKLSAEVINSGQYQLLDNYSNIWRQAGDNSKEAIFEIQTGVFNNSDYGINSYAMFQGPRVGGKGGWRDLGWGFNNPSTTLSNAYETGDKRKAATIIFIDNSGKHVGTTLFDGFRIPSADSVENLRYNYKAYHSEDPNVENYLGNRDRKQKNVHLLRYAEVLLINAEAANELGKTGDALIQLNNIRSRAGLSDSAISGTNELREAIWKERHLELAMEHDRWFDLVRTKKVAEVMKASGKPFVTGKHELLPIPSLQIALSNNQLTQNPNY
ncbi:RagB/SusD family nutrient uptake outer membrane protein [Lacihabitans sp. LS3-19]|uniref:RagB/SusD family nutrient uptake outer membrane protein n=1 Tax=Lacihabitans sp. LS3-19 TaxID=2487335 RepID=UPI0020CC3186|nr:RagB/SusD family nutrient uptake outer membrane protein [Lacihabitans sp. LS3-19]MCP9768309.1 RagB/SusD family nutrient uptake outer membrane protein [Lacihabitans sp. LS3-19]